MYLLDTPDCGKVAWILPPKTGTRSVEKVLRRKQPKATSGRHGVQPADLFSCDLVVSSIRNPFDVLVSWNLYHPSGRQAKTFREWLDKHAGGGGINYLAETTLPGAEHATEYCRYEDGLQEEVNRLFKKFGWAAVVLPHVGKAEGRKPYREYYDHASRKMIERIYADDLERYGYEF